MPKNLYDDLILKLSKKYKLSDLEIERIVDSQFKIVVDTISSKEQKTMNLIYLGKFTPTKASIKKRNESIKEDKAGISNS